MENFKNGAIMASVTFAPSLDNIAVKHDFEQRNIKMISSKGYYYLPDVNDKILLSSVDSKFALGCLNNIQNLQLKPGEIMIKNNAGALIKLLSNGDVQINSITITKSGEIKKQQ